MTSVPCNGCIACCKDDLIVLHPDEGDKPETYETMTITVPSGESIVALARQENGWCIYLTEAGCSIHGRAPLICREFDCRRAFLKWDRATRRMLIAKGMASKEVMDAGRKRLDSLEAWER